VESIGIAVVGAGPAGLSLSRELTLRGLDHVVLERGRVGQSWRDRWDSFCLVTPNWTIQMPGGAYDGADPDGFLGRDAFVEHLEGYAGSLDAPIREGVDVTAIEREPDGSFRLTASAGELIAQRVALATGAFQRPHRPDDGGLPSSILRLDVSDYRNPDGLPDGGVLVVGSGQSGLQIAEELHRAGRDVIVSCGRAPWVPRRIAGRDLVWWGLATGFIEQPVEALPSPGERLVANLQASGRDGGHDLHYRTLRGLGVRLVGRYLGVDGEELRFAADLAESVAFGDQRYRMFMGLVRRHADEQGIDVSDIAEPEPFDATAPERIPVRDVSTVLFAGGFRPAYRDWLPWPDAFDEMGFPIHREGESVAVPGLHFIGVHFLRKRKSSTLTGMGEDASVVAERMAASA
jgi:putative flavoprotein involved in K+ transport